MTKRHETLQALGVFFAIWGLVFFGIWQTPLADVLKGVVDIATTILSFVLGLAYFTYTGTIHWAKHSPFLQKVVFGGAIAFLLTQAILDFVLSVIIWDVFSIDGVNVLTYRDLISILFAIGGIVYIIFVIRVIANRDQYLRQK